MVPVIINTYFPPNTPTPRRCYNLGAAVKACIDEFPSDMRVAVVGSGGLSHMVVEEELDRLIVRALLEKDAEALEDIANPSAEERVVGNIVLGRRGRRLP